MLNRIRIIISFMGLALFCLGTNASSKAISTQHAPAPAVDEQSENIKLQVDELQKILTFKWIFNSSEVSANSATEDLTPSTAIETQVHAIDFSVSHPPSEVYSTEEFIWGTLYRILVPPKGATRLDYACSTGQNSCVKYGPYDPTVGRPDWSTAKFEKE